MESAVPTPAGLPVCAQCGAPFSPAIPGPALCDRCIGLAQPDPLPSPLQGTRVAGFLLVRELGAGRFGTSWLGEDDRGERAVVKLFRAELADSAAAQRYVAEAQRLAAALHHPHLAPLLTAGVHLGHLPVAAYGHGGETTLADELRQRGRFPPERALELCAQVAEGLAACHRAGIAHLDLKPANVGLARDGEGAECVRVLDAATSALHTAAGAQERRPLPLTTASGRAPEHVAGRPGPQSDLYSLGVLLFQLLTGRNPVSGATVDDLLRAHREAAPLRLRDAGRRVDDELEALVARLLSKRPGDRPQGGDEASILLRTVRHGELPLAVVPDVQMDPPLQPEVGEVVPQAPLDPDLQRALLGDVTPAPPTARVRRAGLRVGALAALALAGLAGGVALWRGHRGGEPAAAGARAAVAVSRTAPVAPAVVSSARTPAPVAPRAAPAPASAPASDPYAKELAGARQQLWMGQARQAERALTALLAHRDLPREDRARAYKLLGDATAHQGRRAAAAAWYRRSLAETDDARERTRVQEILAAH